MKDFIAALISNEGALGRVIFSGETRRLDGVRGEIKGHFEYTAVKDTHSVTANGLTEQAVLPGANCGACGYPGCSGFAAAVARGNGADSDHAAATWRAEGNRTKFRAFKRRARAVKVRLCCLDQAI